MNPVGVPLPKIAFRRQSELPSYITFFARPYNFTVRRHDVSTVSLAGKIRISRKLVVRAADSGSYTTVRLEDLA